MSAKETLPDVAGILALPSVLPVMRTMNGGGEETRIVGGAVRNFLMRRPLADIDMTTTARPETVAERATAAGWKVVPTGIDHGTVTVVADHMPFEITTLREDIETDGRHATVRFGRDFEADAKRRDFTMNALSVDLNGGLYDYCGGLADIKKRRICFIGDARQRIREDYLRILRFFRFHAAYGSGMPDREGFLASASQGYGLDRISAERIRVEMLKLFGGGNACNALMAMAEAGVLTRILAGAAEFGRWRRLPEDASAIGQFAVLAVMVREDAERLRDRLRLSNEEHRFLHGYAVLLEGVKGTAKPFRPDDIRRLTANWPLETVLTVFRATRGEPSPHIDVHASKLLKRLASGEEPVPIFPLRGADLVACGVPKGVEIGRRMAEARTLWLEMGCPQGENIREELISLLFEGAFPTEETPPLAHTERE